MPFEALRLTLHGCSALSSRAPTGARELFAILQVVGGRILKISHGPIHPNPDANIEETGSVILPLGLEHQLLEREMYGLKPMGVGVGSFGYIHSSRLFDLSQACHEQKPDHLASVADGQLALGRLLYAHLRPKYGWIDEDGENQPSGRNIAATELRYIFWANFFGPAYVKKFGRKFFMNAPGWKKEELDDGGVLYVVCRNYFQWWSRPQQQALEYFQRAVRTIRVYRSAGFERTEALLARGPARRRRGKKK